MLNEEEYKALSKDLEEVLAKHNVEIIIRSELSFKKVEPNGDDSPKEKTD